MILLNLSGSIYFSSEFKLSSDIIFLLQHNYIPTYLLCAIIAKYITFLYVINPIVLCSCFLNQSKKRELYKIIPYFVINYIAVAFTGSFFFACVFELLSLVTWFHSEELLIIILRMLY
jgi:uncharacterized membrane protein YadS